MQKRSKRGMFCVFESSAEQNIALAVFAKAQPIQVWHSLCLRTLSEQCIALNVLWHSGGKISVHYCVFEKSAEQDIELAMCAAAHPSKIKHLLSRRTKCGTIVFSKAQPSKTLCVLCVSNTQPNTVWLLFLISKAPGSTASCLPCLLVLLKSPSDVYHLSLRFRKTRPA